MEDQKKSIEEQYNFTDAEKDLIRRSAKGNILATYEAQTQASIILAKSIQRAEKSNSRLSFWLTIFTGIMALAALLQFVDTLIDLI
ncbi:MAG: hypothetical protein A3B25_00340 [Candidatus Ryanbacteria bacterium RIFCSPLOWO2_01_FULL_48_26]|uniref:Uncharacterized protein n=1 Tax=Candidatus Ryanbacteria bacterium RIFCSPLOWO2_01_FULL_48_26 TaxID=1802126 RepID=A0A1G2GR16_9BACT|nr:MAG: hypothetical protein A3B25_00340 [Candidatus Ryanbacteria bacterium RIFCSPLOWO2_01_FULL_48_26]